jgi:ribosome assembly protein 4
LNVDFALKTGPFEFGKKTLKTINNNNNDNKDAIKQHKKEEIETTPTTTTKKNNNSKNKTTIEKKVINIINEDLGEEEKNKQKNLCTQQAIALEKYKKILATTSDGTERLVSCSDDFTIFLWSPQTSKTSLTRMTGHQNLINHIVYSPDARFIASASFDKKIKLWCGKTGRFLTTFTGHVASVYQISWSSDSCFIASASKDSTIKIWTVNSNNNSNKNNDNNNNINNNSINSNTKKATTTLSGHEDEVYSLDWNANGSQLASGSKDRTIKMWHH